MSPVPTEEQLRLSEASFRALVEGSPDAIVVHREGRFVYVNPRCVELLGYESAADLIGKPVSLIVHPDDQEKVATRVRMLDDGATQVPFNQERVVRRDGSTFPVEIAGMRVVFQGKPAVVAIARDLSERTRKHAEAAQAERMAAIGLLAAGVAHEINNPLTFVMLHLENLARTLTRLRNEGRAPSPGELGTCSNALDEARFGLDRVGSIVRDLRTFARHDEGEPDLVSMKRVLDAAINLTAHELKYRARVVRQGEEAHAYVIGREGKLCQVFVNLLVNAAQALGSDDTEQNEVVLETRVERGAVTVTVSDNGPGIPRAMQTAIFEPFVTTKGSGSGLGLSICRDIVRAHEGDLRVESEAGGGARFLVSIPHANERIVPSSSHLRVAADVTPSRARLLVVDDEPAILRLVGDILAEAYDLEVAPGGVEAQRILENDRAFDLIVCDVMMPQLSGIQLHAWLEKEAPDLAARMLFMTGGDLGPGGRELADRAPDRFLAKPFTREDLERKVARTLLKTRRA